MPSNRHPAFLGEESQTLNQQIAKTLCASEDRLNESLRKYIERHERLLLQLLARLDKCIASGKDPFICDDDVVATELATEVDLDALPARYRRQGTANSGPSLLVDHRESPTSSVSCSNSPTVDIDGYATDAETNMEVAHSLVDVAVSQIRSEKYPVQVSPSRSYIANSSTVQHGNGEDATGTPTWIAHKMKGWQSEVSKRSWKMAYIEAPEGEEKIGSIYEFCVAALVILHAIWIGFVVDYDATVENHSMKGVFETGGTMFCVCFTIDLSVRFCVPWYCRGSFCLALRKFFMGKDRGWNIFDLLIIIPMALEQALTFFQWDHKPFTRFSMLRSLRLMRVFRVFRVARVFNTFREFRVLLLSIENGIRAMMWIMLFSLFISYVAGIGITHGALEVCSGGRNLDKDICAYFGDLGLTMLSLLKVMLMGFDWGVLLDSLRSIDAFYSCILIAFVIFMHIIVLNVCAAIFLEIQTQSARTERDMIWQDVMRHRNKYVDMLMAIFKDIDINHSGCISKEELELAIEDPAMDALLSAMKLDVHDVHKVFDLLDRDGSGALSIEEFVTGCIRVQGEAKSIDMAMLRQQTEAIFKSIREMKGVAHGSSSSSSSIPHTYAKSSLLGDFKQSLTEDTVSSYSPVPVARSKRKSRRSIPQVEMRAMSLNELRTLRGTILQRCQNEKWTDFGGGLLKPKAVTLYHFNYHHICPVTVPAGVKLSTKSVMVVEKGFLIQQVQKGTTDKDVVAKAIVTESSESNEFEVRLQQGRFRINTEENIDSIIINDVDAGQLVRVKQLGEDISYKEYVSSTPLKPEWFCSHWWGEPVLDFVACCENHVRLRKLNENFASYWVCAYANRQHDLEMDMSDNPEQSSFHKALNKANGALLILDEKATPFRRIWCDYEIYNTITDNKLLDIITMMPMGEDRQVQLLSQRPLPNETPWLKTQRELGFPIHLLIMGIYVKLEEGDASVMEDRSNILRTMTSDVMRQRRNIGEQEALEIALREANATLNAYFAQAAWPMAVKKGIVRDFDKANPGQLVLPEVLRRDHMRKTLALSLGHILELDKTEIRSLAAGLPVALLELHLSFEACHNISDSGVRALAQSLPPTLKLLHLDFLGCGKLTDLGLQEIAKHLPKGLVTLRLDFAKCSQITSEGIKILAKSVPQSLQKFHATFKGTKVDRNFTTVKDLHSILNRRDSKKAMLGHTWTASKMRDV